MVRQSSPPLLLVSLCGWVLLAAAGEGLGSVPLCSPSLRLVTAGVVFSTVYGVGATAALAALLWVLMIVAMTAPLLAQPIAQLRLRSLARRRNRSAGLFTAAYLLVWIAIGPILLAATNAIAVVAAGTGVPALVIAVAIAALWQAAPLRQSALNRCHRVPNLAAFGAEADRDCIRYGLVHGLLCVATCAPAMLLPLTAPQLHLAVMFALSVALQIERLTPPRAPRWTLRIVPGQLAAPVIFRSIRGSVR
jgi:predicted metal-binding membrane protein